MQSTPAKTLEAMEPKPGKASLNQTYKSYFDFITYPANIMVNLRIFFSSLGRSIIYIFRCRKLICFIHDFYGQNHFMKKEF